MKEQQLNTEQKLVNQLRTGNILAFNQIFDLYSSKLFLFAKGYLKTVEDSEELVQEVFTTIWENRHQLRPELSFKSYIFTIAFNVIKKHFRRKTLFQKFANSELLEKSTLETVQEIDYNSLRIHVLQIADSLPEKRREVFIKSRFDGFSNKEIADQLGLSKKTIENHLNMALKEVKNQLNPKNLSSVLFFVLFVD